MNQNGRLLLTPKAPSRAQMEQGDLFLPLRLALSVPSTAGPKPVELGHLTLSRPLTAAPEPLEIGLDKARRPDSTGFGPTVEGPNKAMRPDSTAFGPVVEGTDKARRSGRNRSPRSIQALGSAFEVDGRRPF